MERSKKYTIGEIYDRLRSACDFPGYSWSEIGPQARALKYFYETTSEDSKWRDAQHSADDFTRRKKLFSSILNKENTKRGTISAYSSRAGKAIDIFFNDVERNFETDSKGNNSNSEFDIALRQYNKKLLKNALDADVNSDSLEVFVFQKTGSEIAAFVVSRNTKKEDLETEYEFLSELLNKKVEE